MEHTQRPPRSVPPPGAQQHLQHQTGVRSPLSAGAHNVSFALNETGDRGAPLPSGRQQRYSASIDPNALAAASAAAASGAQSDPEAVGARMARKRSLVRPERERIDPSHRQWHYRSHAAQMEEQANSRMAVHPSTTGNLPVQGGLRRGKSLLARDTELAESGLQQFKRSTTLRRRKQVAPVTEEKKSWLDGIAPGPKDAWMIYCWVLTCCVPPFLLSSCGLKTPEQQRAWREKMGLLAIILLLMAGVGFLTFGFQATVCGKPPNQWAVGTIDNRMVIIHGLAYNLSDFKHPAAGATFDGNKSPISTDGFNVGGQDVSFMFQRVNGSCNGIITPASNSFIPSTAGNLHWYFPCNSFSQFGATQNNRTGYDSAYQCHATSRSRDLLSNLKNTGLVSYNWTQVTDGSRNLAVFKSSVLDMSLLNWLDTSAVKFPNILNEMKNKNETYAGKDITMYMRKTGQMNIANCLDEIIKVGEIDTKTIGCVASQVVLIVSLVFIIGVVAIKFAMAVIFGWFLSWKLGSFTGESYQSRMQRAAEIEQWSDDIYRAAPARYRPNVPGGKQTKSFLPDKSRFSKADVMKGGARPFSTYEKPRPAENHKARPNTTYSTVDSHRKSVATQSLFSGKSGTLAPPDSVFRGSRSSSSLPSDEASPCPFPLYNVVAQPAPDYMPYNFPLAHTICLVTAYSESVEGLRTTLDSLATTDYPNSHKLIMVITDGMVKGSGNDKYTPDIVLSMMKELVIPANEVQPHSYVAIADGHKRHNMAKVFAGYYDYDSDTVEPKKQQRVPMVLVSKVGNPLEQSDVKPGNRGKRDSQIVLMSFLQKIMFDERMTTFEFEFFNSIWRCTGVCPDKYELVLCVDADTKVFPDSLTRMAACMVNDPDIMGLCGETKIANKSETWVTMIQVFEYYISHHMTKAFESMFGGVTCLPGCFSMYRIKAPKTENGYWVPVLANPDIVEHYSENIVDTLHKKNLLLLGEDRYLTTLMLKTFPKRKMVFCPQAVCKTIVPDEFGILLSQRRRWINSTIHNLAELLLVRDLCGTFCFSMQFVVFMELAGTLVLPAAISFTIYLIVSSAIGDAKNNIIPLVLLGIILGLPGLLIVLTSRKIAYVGWMLVYLLSLPIWNFVLPAYAFWHFDDFSWGQTRMVSGEKKGGGHGDKEGEFDSSHIVMKRWAEFERERRWKLGSHSRDSTFLDPSQSMAPRRPGSHRQSLVSMQDPFDPYARPPTFMHSQHSDSPEGSPHTKPRNRQDSAPLLMLPAPLALSNQQSGSVSSSLNDSYIGPGPDAQPNYRLHRAPDDPSLYIPDMRDSDAGEANSPNDSTPMMSPSNRSLNILGQGAVMRSVTGGSSYPGETQNPYRHSQHHTAAYEQAPTFLSPTAENEGVNVMRPPRGVSLVDHGVVASPDGPVRRTKNSSKRASASILSASSAGTQPRYKHQSLPPPPASPTSSSSQHQYLPPGAAPPQPQQLRNYQGQ